MLATATGSLRIILSSPDYIVREGLKSVLRHFKKTSLEFVAETQSISELPQLVHAHEAHIAIVHLKAAEENLLEDCYTELQNWQGAVILLSEQKSQPLVLKMLHLGIPAFLVSNSEPAEVCEAVNSVYKGETYYCPAAAKKIYDFVVSPNLEIEQLLSKQERKIIELICLQYSRDEIADRLEISQRTVDEYKRKIEIKTGSKNIAGVILFAVKNKMIDLDE